MARKKRGNDTIPSWSGFNYQGKVMLLYVLQRMNVLLGKVALSEYSVELEKREDFVIVHTGKSESFHQVKATLSKSKWSSHSAALDKLIQNRNSSDNPLAPCYFVVAKGIDDWNDISNTYSSSSYLILFWRVAVINESIYPQIIQLEENEFFFKKYVFYYTQEELDAFSGWLSEMSSAGKVGLSDLLEELSSPTVNFDTPYVSFFIRLLIKVPFWNLVFPQAILRDFDSIVDFKIAGTRGSTSEKVKELDSMIAKAIASGVTTVNAISDIIYKSAMEE